jgi:hypothetical protein
LYVLNVVNNRTIKNYTKSNQIKSLLKFSSVTSATTETGYSRVEKRQQSYQNESDFIVFEQDLVDLHRFTSLMVVKFNQVRSNY